MLWMKCKTFFFFFFTAVEWLNCPVDPSFTQFCLFWLVLCLLLNYAHLFPFLPFLFPHHGVKWCSADSISTFLILSVKESEHFESGFFFLRILEGIYMCSTVKPLNERPPWLETTPLERLLSPKPFSCISKRVNPSPRSPPILRPRWSLTQAFSVLIALVVFLICRLFRTWFFVFVDGVMRFGAAMQPLAKL